MSFVGGVLDNLTTVLELDGSTYTGSSLPSSGWHELLLQSGSSIYRVMIDMYQDEHGPQTFVIVEQEIQTDLNNLKGGDRFFVDAGNGQFFEVEVRFVRDGNAKLEFFMPPPPLHTGCRTTQSRWDLRGYCHLQWGQRRDADIESRGQCHLH